MKGDQKYVRSILLDPIVFSGRHNSKLLGFVTSPKLTFKKTDRDIHDAYSKSYASLISRSVLLEVSF